MRTVRRARLNSYDRLNVWSLKKTKLSALDYIIEIRLLPYLRTSWLTEQKKNNGKNEFFHMFLIDSNPWQGMLLIEALMEDLEKPWEIRPIY